jgi:hypothetical protein
MSTQINVTVDSGGLRQRDKQQRHALRLGKVEADNQRKVEARATDARTAELRKALLGTDGKPLFGTPTPATLRRDEPAAFRTASMYEALLKPSNSSISGLELSFDVQVKGGSAFAVKTTKRWRADSNEFGFSGTGFIYYDNLDIYATDIIERLPAGGPIPSQPAMRFKRWPAILNKGTYKSEINYIIEIDDRINAATRKPAGKKPPGDFTLEFYLQLSETAVSSGAVYSGFRQFALELRNPVTDDLFAEIISYTEDDPNSGNNCVAIYGWLDNNGNEQQKTDVIVSNAHQWHHYAICRKSGQLSAYLDGARVSGPHATTYAATSNGLDIYLISKADQTIDYGTVGLPLYTPDAARVSNVLFSTKALYDGPFTPTYLAP